MTGARPRPLGREPSYDGRCDGWQGPHHAGRGPARAGQEQRARCAGEQRPTVPLDAVPGLLVTLDDLRGLPLDNRDAFVVSFIDGRCTVEMIADMAGLDLTEVVGILSKLLRLGAIDLHAPA